MWISAFFDRLTIILCMDIEDNGVLKVSCKHLVTADLLTTLLMDIYYREVEPHTIELTSL